MLLPLETKSLFLIPISRHEIVENYQASYLGRQDDILVENLNMTLVIPLSLLQNVHLSPHIILFFYWDVGSSAHCNPTTFPSALSMLGFVEYYLINMFMNWTE